MTTSAYRLAGASMATAALFAVAACGGAPVRPAAGAAIRPRSATAPQRPTATTSPMSSPASRTAPAVSTSPSTGKSSRPLAGKVIALDPGHNGQNWAHPEIINQLVNVITEQKPCDTTGTQTDTGYTEHAFNFDVAMRLAALLRQEGARIVLTRADDAGVGPCVTQRAEIGNRAHASAAISIHADGGPPGGTGFDVIAPGLVAGYTDRIVAPSRRLAAVINGAFHKITGEPYASYVGDNGIDIRTDLGGLNLSTVPKVFIECGNMRNAWDAARLSTASYRQQIAVALAAGFTAFLA